MEDKLTIAKLKELKEEVEKIRDEAHLKTLNDLYAAGVKVCCHPYNEFVIFVPDNIFRKWVKQLEDNNE